MATVGACDSIQQQGASLVRAVTKKLEDKTLNLQANRHSSLLNPELEALGLTRLLRVPSPCPFAFNPEGNLTPSSNTGAHPKSHHVKQDKCHPGRPPRKYRRAQRRLNGEGVNVYREGGRAVRLRMNCVIWSAGHQRYEKQLTKYKNILKERRGSRWHCLGVCSSHSSIRSHPGHHGCPGPPSARARIPKSHIFLNLKCYFIN